MKASIDKVLLQIALDLSADLANQDHYQKLIDSVKQVLPCDASALFISDQQGALIPVAVSGLSATIIGQKFLPQQHPRLAAIIKSAKPVRFDAHSPLPDPFDGLLAGVPDEDIDVHDCMGCGLYVDNQLVGVLTLDAMKVGAFDVIDPITIETFAALAAVAVKNKMLFTALQEANKQQASINQLLIAQARDKEGELVGQSTQIAHLRDSIAMVAPLDYAVLISGETGTGKELVAHAVHNQSQRRDKPMVYVNCAALPESIAESELFGHVKGAFTGANSHRQGKFELADQGTIFLDELGELSLGLQAKLLRVIQQGELQRVGADKHHVVDVRIIAATNRQLDVEVAEGRFRADLYHRLNVFPIFIPPLREREGDIALLTGYLLNKIKNQLNIANIHLHPSCLTLLENQSWPGNVRELEHTLMRVSLRAIQQGEFIIRKRHFSEAKTASNQVADNGLFPEQSTPMRETVELFQKQLIEHALGQANGVWAQAAEFLQVDRGNLHRLGKKLGASHKG